MRFCLEGQESAPDQKDGKVNYVPCASSASTSSRLGIDGAVPCRVTEMPATAQPNRAASTGGRPSASATANPPLNASPAPVVSSTGPAGRAGTIRRTDAGYLWRLAQLAQSQGQFDRARRIADYGADVTGEDRFTILAESLAS